MDGLFREFKLSEALKILYSLIWDDFCSWYLEWVKPGFEKPIAGPVYIKTVAFFEQLLQLLHPFMPFITEEIYHLLQDQSTDLCITQYPADIPLVEENLTQTGDLLQLVISSIRDAKNKNQIKPKETVELYVQTDQMEAYRKVETILCRQVNAKGLQFVSLAPENTLSMVCGKDKIYLKTDTPVNTQSQKQELEKELEHLRGFLVIVEKKLGNERFVQNAKPEILALEQKKKADAEDKIKAIEESLANLS